MNELQITPRNKESEEYVLGAIMLEPGCIPLVIDKLHEDVFYFDLHRYVFRAISRLYNESQPVDSMMVVERMNRMKLLSSNITPVDVARITNEVRSTANVEAHSLILQQYYLQREAIRLGADMAKRGYSDDPFDLLDSTASDIMKLQESATRGRQKSILDYVVAANKERDAILQNGGVIGISTGLNRLDEMVKGLVSPDLLILAARPSMGKTAFALTIFHHVTVDLGIPSGFFSLEMSEIQLVNRLESIESGIDHDKIRSARLSEQEGVLLQQSDAKIARSPIYIDGTASINIRELRTKASIWKRKYGVQFIVVDYLQLMSPVSGKGKTREQEISEISRGLKIIAKELEIPVMALSQLSRDVEKRPDKIPQLSDLRESGSIEQDADSVIFLMRPAFYDSTSPVEIGGETYDPRDLVITKIAKNRHGDTKSIPLYFDGPKMTFKNERNSHFTQFRREPADYYEPAEKPF